MVALELRCVVTSDAHKHLHARMSRGYSWIKALTLTRIRAFVAYVLQPCHKECHMTKTYIKHECPTLILTTCRRTPLTFQKRPRHLFKSQSTRDTSLCHLCENNLHSHLLFDLQSESTYFTIHSLEFRIKNDLKQEQMNIYNRP